MGLSELEPDPVKQLWAYFETEQVFKSLIESEF